MRDTADISDMVRTQRNYNCKYKTSNDKTSIDKWKIIIPNEAQAWSNDI